MASKSKGRRSGSRNRPEVWKIVGLITALLVPIAAILTAVVKFWPSEEAVSQTVTVTGSSNSVDQANTQVSVGPGGCVAVNGSTCGTSPEAAAELRRQAEALPGADAAPAGKGPWLFAVYGTGDQGLLVRDGTTVDSDRIGVVLEGRPVYVDCFRSDWNAQQLADDPHPSMRSDRWYRVRYPETGDVGDSWMNSGFLLPIGHNGGVPVCS